MHKTSKSFIFTSQQNHLLAQLIALAHYVTQSSLLGVKFGPYLGFNCWCWRRLGNTESVIGVRTNLTFNFILLVILLSSSSGSSKSRNWRNLPFRSHVTLSRRREWSNLKRFDKSGWNVWAYPTLHEPPADCDVLVVIWVTLLVTSTSLHFQGHRGWGPGFCLSIRESHPLSSYSPLTRDPCLIPNLRNL